jgi:hypothetical protein
MDSFDIAEHALPHPSCPLKQQENGDWDKDWHAEESQTFWLEATHLLLSSAEDFE